MKYTIEGFSQQEMLSKGLDCVDAVILRYILDFWHTGKMKIIRIDGMDHFWISLKHIREAIPIAGLKTNDSVYRRMKKYIDAGIMQAAQIAGSGTTLVYRFVEDSILSLVNFYSSSNENDANHSEGSDLNPRGGRIYIRGHSSIIDNNINTLHGKNTFHVVNNRQNSNAQEAESSDSLPLISEDPTPPIPPPPPAPACEAHTEPANNADKVTVSMLVALWCDIAAAYNLPCIRLPLTESRRRKAALRANEMKAQDVAAIRAEWALSPLLRGNVAARGGNGLHGAWKPCFDWLVGNDTNWVKIVEGKYRDRDASVSTSSQDSERW